MKTQRSRRVAAQPKTQVSSTRLEKPWKAILSRPGRDTDVKKDKSFRPFGGLINESTETDARGEEGEVL